jgi:hypothetical protein
MEKKQADSQNEINENYTIEEIKPFCSFCGLFAKYMVKSKINSTEIYYICTLEENRYRECRKQLDSFMEAK